MGQIGLKIKNSIKGTSLGKKARDAWQRRGFTYQAAERVYNTYQDRFAPEEKDRIIKDMLVEAKKHSFGFDEYMMYHFYDMPESERRTYVSDLERITYCERMNQTKNMILFDDKGQTYSKFREYYKRDLIGVFHDKDLSAFTAFVQKHPRFIVKPYDGACGIGIKIVENTGDPAELFESLRNTYKAGFVAEELIVQAESMGKPHPKSVNTIRITTIRYDDRIEIVHPFWRTGRGGSCVDNGGSGGIICALDPDTGIVVAAADEKGVHYDVHPESGHPLVGFQIPDWEDAVRLSKELALRIPDNRYTGWDLALTDDGWVLQEANDRGAFVGFQLPIQKGFREEIEAIMGALKL